MKYMTKSWYNNMTKLFIPIEFNECQDANTFSDTVFKKYYLKDLEEYLDFTECYPTRKKAIDLFEKDFEKKILLVKEYFPSEFLENVKDLRMLALGKVEKENIDYINKILNQKRLNCEKILEEYDMEYNKIKDKLSNNIKKNSTFHDCMITEIIKTNNKLVIKIDNSANSGNISIIEFKDYEIIEEEMEFINGWILYDEIYIVENEYELHLLIEAPKDNNFELGYFTIKAKDMIFNASKS